MPKRSSLSRRLAGAVAAVLAAGAMMAPTGAHAVSTDLVLHRSLGMAAARYGGGAADDVFRLARHVWKADLFRYIKPSKIDDALVDTLVKGAHKSPDEAADLVRKLREEGSDAVRRQYDDALAAAVKKLHGEYKRVAVVYDDSLTRLVGKEASGKPLSATQRRLYAREVIEKLNSGAKIHPAILDLEDAAQVAGNQILAAQRLSGKVPDNFAPMEGMSDVVKALNARHVKQATNGKLYLRRDGYFMTLDEARGADLMLSRLAKGTPMEDLTAREMRELVIAKTRQVNLQKLRSEKAALDKQFKELSDAGQDTSAVAAARAKNANALEQNEMTAFQNDLLDAYKRGDADARVVAKQRGGDDVAEEATEKVAKSADDVAAAVKAMRRKYKRADFDAQVAAADLRLGVSGKSDLGLFEFASDRVEQALRGASGDVRLGPSADALVTALRNKKGALEAARKANGGKLPHGMKDLSKSEKEALAKLEEFFNGPMPVFRGNGGVFESRATVEYYQKLREALTGSPDEMAAFFKTGGKKLDKFVKEHLQYYDTELERSMRKAFKRAQEKLPEENFVSTTYIRGSGRTHGTGGYSTQINYGDEGYTQTTTLFDSKWLDDALARDPAHRVAGARMDKSVEGLDSMPWQNRAPPKDNAEVVAMADAGGFPAVMRRLEDQYRAVANRVAHGKELTEEQVKLVREVLAKRPPTLPQDIYLSRLVRNHEQTMLQVVNPGTTVAPRFPKTVAREATEEAESVARAKQRVMDEAATKGQKLTLELQQLQKEMTQSTWDMVRRTGSDHSMFPFAPEKIIKENTFVNEVLPRVEGAIKGDRFLAVSSRDLLKQLKREKELYAEAKRIYPSDRQRTLDALETYFKKDRVPRAGTGEFYSEQMIQKADDLAKKAMDGAYQKDAYRLVDMLKDILKKPKGADVADDAVQTALRKAIKEADAAGKLPTRDVVVERLEDFHGVSHAREPNVYHDVHFSRKEFDDLIYPDGVGKPKHVETTQAKDTFDDTW